MKFDNNTDYEPVTGFRKWLRNGFAMVLLLVAAFAVTMVLWGDLRETIMVRFVDDKVRQTIVFSIDDKTNIWVGEFYLRRSEAPKIGDGKTDNGIEVEHLSVLKPRTYLEGPLFSKVGIEIPEGFDMAPWKVTFPDATVLLQGKNGPDLRWAAIKNIEGELDWVGLVRLPDAGSEPERLYLFRIEKLGQRGIKGLSLEVHTEQMRIKDNSFWAERIEQKGLPEKTDGQIRLSWILQIETYESDAAARKALPENSRELNWTALLPKKDE